jgi:hypothetical protein
MASASMGRGNMEKRSTKKTRTKSKQSANYAKCKRVGSKNIEAARLLKVRPMGFVDEEFGCCIQSEVEYFQVP